MDGSNPVAVEENRDLMSEASRRDDLFFNAVETTRMPMIVTDPHQADNPIIFVNRAFERMTGYTRDELIGTNCRFLQGPETDREVVTELRLAIAEQREFSTEIINYRKDGSSFWNALFVSPVFNRSGDLVYFFPILPSVPFISRLMFSRCMNQSSSVSPVASKASCGAFMNHRKIGVMALAVSAERDE